MTIPCKHAKVCVVGEVSVGKTCIINRTINDDYQNDYKRTVAEAFRYKYTKDGQNVEFQIWDTAGAVEYRTLLNLYMQKSNVIIVVYDITDSDSYQALRRWAQDIPQDIFDSGLVVLVGNKTDLEESRKIEFSQAENFSVEHDFSKCFEVSAKTGEGIANLWEFIATSPEIQNLPDDSTIVENTTNNTANGAADDDQGIFSTIFGYLNNFYQYIKSFF